jgi:hypothetical protein
MRFMQEFHDAVLAPLYRPKAEQEVALRESEGCTVLLVSATFQDLADIAARVPSVKNPEKLIVARIMLEIMDADRKRYLFVER